MSIRPPITFRSSYISVKLGQMPSYLISKLTPFVCFLFCGRQNPCITFSFRSMLVFFVFVFLSGTVSLEGVCKGMSDSLVNPPFFRCFSDVYTVGG